MYSILQALLYYYQIQLKLCSTSHAGHAGDVPYNFISKYGTGITILNPWHITLV